MKKLILTGHLILSFMLSGQSQQQPGASNSAGIRLVTLDPGHFHAALVQKTMYPGVDPVVHVYAPAGADVQLHLDRINAYNKRGESPTRWEEKVYTGNNFFEKMLSEKAGNVVVLSGNNQKKTAYISQSLDAGFHVLADKPMVINSIDFGLLETAFQTAKNKNLLLYDIMTERFEITTVLQRELSMMPQVFGTLRKGTADEPAVTIESIHYFYKTVSGNVLTRPAWFMDVRQQGEGIVDVATHLVDLAQWECFPGKALDYRKDVQNIQSKRWTTDMTLSQFKAITGLSEFPAYLKKDVEADSILKVYVNGQINYMLRDVHVKITATWDFKAPEGSGDQHYSQMRGTKANLVIRQEAASQYQPALYIEPVAQGTAYGAALQKQFKKIEARFPGVTLKKSGKGWEVVIPAKYREGHESHFGQVTAHFLEYLNKRNMPAWEVPNMLAKYYTTTKALEVANKK